MLTPNELLKANDIVYLLAAYDDLYAWGYVIKRSIYPDYDLKEDALKITVTRPIVRNGLVPADEIKRVPALVRLFANSNINLIEMNPHQVNSFNRLIRSKGVEAPEDIEDFKKPETHLDRLMKIYDAANGSRTQLIELMEVLKGEFANEDEAWDEVDYMKDEGWVEVIGDNGPPLVRLVHNGIKRAQAYKAILPKTPVHDADTLVLSMKHCPKCNQAYPETLNFCTEDGTPLVSDSYKPDADTAK